MFKNTFANIDLFNKSLSASWMRNKAISNNIANVNTPNYKREDVSFEDVLKRSLDKNSIKLQTSDSRHIDFTSNLTPIYTKDSDTAFRKDGNNVNIDTEMAKLAENQIKYNALTRQLNDTFKRIKMAIK